MLKHAPPEGLRVGLALGAGGARGYAHVPVLEAFDELGIKPAVVSGASIGSIMGAGYCAGMSGAEIRDYIESLFRRGSDVLGRLWKVRPRTAKEMFAAGAWGIGQFDAERVLEAFLPDTIPRDFADLQIPLKIVACDFYGWRETVLEEGNLRKAIAASIAIPVLFRPVLLEDRVMVDGTLFNPVPFDLVCKHTDIVVAVDVIGGPTGPANKVPSTTEAIFGTTQLLMRAILRPEINAFRLLDFRKAATILKAADPVKDEVKRALEKAMKQAEAAARG